MSQAMWDEKEEEEEKMVVGDVELAQQVFQRAYKDLKSREFKEDDQAHN